MARSGKSARDLLENRPFYKNVKAMIALATGLTGAVVGFRSFVTTKPPEVVHDTTELIIDRSKRMGDAWEGTSRLAVAVNAADKILGTIATGENLALREFGGPCKGPNTVLDVSFAENNVKRVREHVNGLWPGGQATLYSAINEAIGDFGRQKYFEGVNRRILVISGSDDTCGNAYLMDAITGKLEEHAKHYNIRLDIHFLGVGLDRTQKENLMALAKVTGGAPVFADHPADLERLLRDALKSPGPSTATDSVAASAGNPASGEEAKTPVRQDTGVLVDSLKAGVKDLDDALKDLATGDFGSAQASLAAARRAGERSDVALANLGQGQRQKEFRELYDAASRCRTIHRQLLAKAQIMVKQFQEKDSNGYKLSSAEYDHLVDEFDRTAKRINALLTRL